MGDVAAHPAPGGRLSAPAAISGTHDVSRFDCGKQPLNDWLRTKAKKSEGFSARCYVVTAGPADVVGYYALNTGAVAHEGAPRLLRANMPVPTPVMVLGRLAVDQEYRQRGVGSGMLKDAFSRVLAASRIAGFRALLVHCIDEDAVPFYASFSFKSFPSDMLTMYLPVETIMKAVHP